MNTAALDALVTALAAQTPPVVDPAAILAAANADPVCASAIPQASLQVWLGNNALTPRLTATANYVAALPMANQRTLLNITVNEISDADFPAYVTLNVVNQILGFCVYTGPVVDMTDPTIAGKVTSLIGLAEGLNAADATKGITPAEAGALVALAGGYQVYDATSADVTASLARLAAVAAQQALRTAYNTINMASVNRYNAEQNLLGQLLAAGTQPPADLAALDALISGGG